MATDKAELMYWLGDIADDAEIGIEVGGFGQLALIAKLGEDIRLIDIGDVPYPAEQADAEVSRERMLERLREMRTDAMPVKGVMIVTIDGVVSGAPDLFSMSVHEAYRFRDRTQAKKFIDEFYYVMRHALMLAC